MSICASMACCAGESPVFIVMVGVLTDSDLAAEICTLAALLLLGSSFLDGLDRESTASAAENLGATCAVANFTDSETTPSIELAPPFATTAGFDSPCAPFHFFTTWACCTDAGSGLSVLFRLILFMKFGISTTGMGLDLCNVDFSMILSPGDSVLHGRRNMDCIVREVEVVA
ncbi:hypothetical protein HBI56_218730 [Parastagonospora nodorum]|nr:hypothetical protein HBH56_225330 [Parastagonospora nodorum]KAH3935454.1 hypothetical protein HBH54_033400 [Parastagonospora nodorum]KAH3940058.1 hypothetical protein HBH53_223360 [Parastagonospora nodorum]KAH3957606.1 hypothetical protein HBH51_223340 [Parastagonospora nodorum]KAH3988781.1 hypothetical protein HBH52_022570 [Parastagonospora nodorum]